MHRDRRNCARLSTKCGIGHCWNSNTLWGGGPVGIIVGLITAIIAALNLIVDFDFVEQGSRSGAPKYMEWYAAFGLTVTLIWLYTEILWLLSKARESEQKSS
jgi:uncharacterized YccA/Bax inhibitor family protein